MQPAHLKRLQLAARGAEDGYGIRSQLVLPGSLAVRHSQWSSYCNAQRRSAAAEAFAAATAGGQGCALLQRRRTVMAAGENSDA